MLLSELKLMLNQLTDPSNEMTIGETDSLKHISYDEEKDLVILKIAMGRLGGENEKKFRRENSKNRWWLFRITIAIRRIKNFW